MKEIKAFIRPEKLNTVTDNLRREQFCCFTVFEGEGVGNYADPETKFPSLRFPFLHSKVIKLEIVCNQEDVKSIVAIIKEHAHTGKSGDGLIYISPVDQQIRIRD